MEGFNIVKIRNDFPILRRTINGKKLVYLDNAATTQKPQSVIDAPANFYSCYNANIHRGIHSISEEATGRYEETRQIIADFIGAQKEEVVFTKGTTEGVNLVAFAWGEENVKVGDNIVVTDMEHHSNFLPWQRLANSKKANFRKVSFYQNGKLDLKDLFGSVDPKTKIVALTHVSNVFGLINPIEAISQTLREKKGFKGIIIIDGAQSVPHIKIKVGDLGCDFLVFSGHKMLGPTGTGVLWGKKELLEKMHPFQTGGHMLKEVREKDTLWEDPPFKFEAGTQNIEGVIGLGQAVLYLTDVRSQAVKYEKELTNYAFSRLSSIPRINIMGQETLDRLPVFTFTLKDLHPHDIAQLLAEEEICVRAGHHCTQPLHARFRIQASCRASLYFYNTKEEVDFLVENLKRAVKILKK